MLGESIATNFGAWRGLGVEGVEGVAGLLAPAYKSPTALHQGAR